MKTTLVVPRTDFLSAIGQPNSHSVNTRLSSTASDKLWNLNSLLASRSWVESDTRFVQPIAYVTLVRYAAGVLELLVYERGSGSNEKRLVDQYSIGYGGHIEELPKDTLGAVVASSAERELVEELGPQVLTPEVRSHIASGIWRNPHVYWDSSTSVNSVHFGVLVPAIVSHEFEITAESGVINNARWLPIHEVDQLPLESWSRIALNSIVARD